MKETNQLRKLMEAVEVPDLHEDGSVDTSSLFAELQELVDEMPGSHYENVLRMLINKYRPPVTETQQELGEDRLSYDIEFDNEDLTIFTLGGKPVLEMPLDDWMELISKFNRMMGSKQEPRRY